MTSGDQRNTDARGAQLTEAMLATAFDLGPIILTITRLADGRFVEVNNRFLETTGYTREEVIGKTPIDVNLWVRPEQRSAGLRGLLEGKSIHEVEAEFRMKDGTIRTCLMSGSLIDLNGETCVLTALTDISERKQADAVLQRYQLLSQRTRDIILFVAADGRIVDANSAAVAAYGYDHATLLSLRIHDLRVSDTRALITHQMSQADHGGTMFTTLHRRKDGSIFPVEVSTIGADISGERLLVSIIRDVGEWEQAEAERVELLEREHSARVAAEEAMRRVARMQAISAALSMALTPRQVAEIAVDHAIDAFGARRGVVALLSADGAGLQFLNQPEALAEQQSADPMTLDSQHPIAQAARTQTLVIDGEPGDRRRYGAQVAVPLVIEERTLGVLALMFNSAPALSSDDLALLWSLAQQCSQALYRAQLYEAERMARAEAEAAVKVRDTFLTTAAHELKTPLTVLLGNVQLLQRRLKNDSSLQEREARQLRVVGEQALRLNHLITSMLDISRLETRQLTITPTSFDLVALMRRVIDDIEPTLTAHELEIALPDAPVTIVGDEMRLEQVFHNLLSNAIKYSPEGGRIGVRMEMRDGMVCMSVSDQGVGIPPASLARIFERFYRADNIDPRAITGVGIGLYVVHAIVERHGGRIGVESVPGQGSIFTIELPLSGHLQHAQPVSAP